MTEDTPIIDNPVPVPIDPVPVKESIFPAGPYGDLYNARVFTKRNMWDVLWNKNGGGFYIWSNHIWELDCNNTIKRYAIKIFDEMKDYNFQGTPEQISAWNRHVKATGQNGRLEAMIDIAKTLCASSIELDNLQWDLNVHNGTVDLKTGYFYEHNKADYLTKICRASYKEGPYQCPLWLAFLDQIFMGDASVIEFMQKVIGYSLTGVTSEQCLFILWGDGSNGKSSFMETIAYMLNNYALNSPMGSLLQQQRSGASNDIARLKSSRLVTVAENSQNASLDEGMIKILTAQDKITARFLYGENFEFHPTFKIFWITNHKPTIKGTDKGIWRRIRMIPFLLNLKEDKIDKFLGDKLKNEIDGILAWAVEGCLKWQKEGLKSPLAIEEATRDYEKDEDRIGKFIDDEFVKGEKMIISISLFKEKLFEYLGHKMSQKTIAEHMRKKGYLTDLNLAYIDGKKSRVYTGLGLRSEYGDDEPSASGSTAKTDPEFKWEE